MGWNSLPSFLGYELRQSLTTPEWCCTSQQAEHKSGGPRQDRVKSWHSDTLFLLKILVRVLQSSLTVLLLDTQPLMPPLAPLVSFGTMESQLWPRRGNTDVMRHTLPLALPDPCPESWWTLISCDSFFLALCTAWPGFFQGGLDGPIC